MLWFNEIKLPRGRRGKARNMIKKTRWSLSVSVMPSQAMVDMPWPRPHTPHLHEFKARAERYRRRRRIGLGLMIGFMVVGVLMMSLSRYLPEEAPIWGGGLMAAAWLFTLLIFLFGLRLRCPACKKRLEPARGLYCPMCGSDQFEYGRHKIGPSFSRYPYCPSCGLKIYDPSGDDARTYRIRGCTHCGVFLDENGL